jgi:regulation of enolase protein 1 (concanavalin A-like superfamily)
MQCAALQVERMRCSPERAGFEVTLRDFCIDPAIDPALHPVS